MFAKVNRLCINQNDNTERSAQVGSMSRIYLSAACVLVFLGIGNSDIQAAFRKTKMGAEYLEKFVQDFRSRNSSEQESQIHTDSKALEDNTGIQDNDSDDLPILRTPSLVIEEPTNSELAAIDKIFQHPWWERVWVIQEATLAKALYVICGHESLPWTVLSQIYPTFVNHSSQIERSPHEKLLEPLHRLNQMRVQWMMLAEEFSEGYNQAETSSLLRPRRPTYLKLENLVPRFRSCKSTDPRDKIYALLGLADDYDSIVADYSISSLDAYVRFAEAQIVSYQRRFREGVDGNAGKSGLRLLDYCLPPSPKTPGLPSWVPDWQVSISDMPVSKDIFPDNSVSNHGRGAMVRWEGHIQTQIEPYTLTIRGFIVDRIINAGETVPMSKRFLEPLITTYFTAWSVVEQVNLRDGELWSVPVRESDLQSSLARLAELEEICTSIAVEEDIHPKICSYITQLCDVSRIMSSDAAWPAGERVSIGDNDSVEFVSHIHRCTSPRRYFVTKTLKFGLGRLDVRVGDLVCIFLGAEEPYILREENGHYVFVGNCFCEGLMADLGLSNEVRNLNKDQLVEFEIR
ncbi:HET-domain-containing protein [Acephala macrosclerotiorum]|nr:HET-domain-containing protein [Acephala macrosclerotiorum]